jgi:hypothetical protein
MKGSSSSHAAKRGRGMSKQLSKESVELPSSESGQDRAAGGVSAAGKKASAKPDRRRIEGATMSKSKSSAAAVKAPESVAPQEFGEGEFEAETPARSTTSSTGEVEVLEEEFDIEGAVTEPVLNELESIRPPKPPSDKEIEEGGGDSMLARYFREMATHPVMGPDEELQTAIEVEQAEIDHWVAIFSYLPSAEFVMISLEKDLPTGEDALDLPQSFTSTSRRSRSSATS